MFRRARQPCGYWGDSPADLTESSSGTRAISHTVKLLLNGFRNTLAGSNVATTTPYSQWIYQCLDIYVAKNSCSRGIYCMSSHGLSLARHRLSAPTHPCHGDNPFDVQLAFEFGSDFADLSRSVEYAVRAAAPAALNHWAFQGRR